MPRRPRKVRRKRTATLARLRQLLRDGEPWSGPVPGVSAASPHLTELLTGHDYFGLAHGGDDGARRRLWAALRDDVLAAHAVRAVGGAPLPWAHRRYDLGDPAAVVAGERPPGAATLTVGDTDCWFDEMAVDRVVTFFAAFLRVPEGPATGRPLRLFDWQIRDIVRPVYGWKRERDGLRRIRDVFVGLPKKNGKSLLASGLSLYHLTADGEPQPKIYALSADKDNVRETIYGVVLKLVRRSPVLTQICRALESRVENRLNAGVLRCLTALPKHGHNASVVLFDELHTVTDKLWDVMNGATASFAQPLRIALTTAGEDRTTVCWKRWRAARRAIADPAADPQLHGVTYSAMALDSQGREQIPAGWSDPSRWDDPALWARVNPAMAEQPPLAEFLRREARIARLDEAAKLRFWWLHLNLWTHSEVRFLDLAEWDRCERAFDAEHHPCIGSALDLAHSRDLSAWVRGYDLSGDVIGVVGRYWIPRADIVERTARDHVPYREWAERGLIEATEGNVTDFDVIRDHILAATEDPQWRDPEHPERLWIAYDARFASQLVTQLSKAGLWMIPYRQGYADMALATEELRRRVRGAKLAHDGDPVLRWMAGNAVGVPNEQGHLRLSKARSKEKIDGIVCTAMLLGWWLRAQNAEPGAEESAYNQHPDAGLMLV